MITKTTLFYWFCFVLYFLNRYENDGDQVFTENIITTTADFLTTASVFDVDRDGQLDVVVSQRPIINWYSNDNQVFTKHNITIHDNEAGYSHVWPLDFDFDGDIDFLSITYISDTVAW